MYVLNSSFIPEKQWWAVVAYFFDTSVAPQKCDFSPLMSSTSCSWYGNGCPVSNPYTTRPARFSNVLGNSAAKKKVICGYKIKFTKLTWFYQKMNGL